MSKHVVLDMRMSCDWIDDEDECYATTFSSIYTTQQLFEVLEDPVPPIVVNIRRARNNLIDAGWAEFIEDGVERHYCPIHAKEITS